MEEKAVEGKEKKHVLVYTVVGEDRGRAGVGVWVVRVLLGTLLLVALAVVPYLSLRLAQVSSDRTLVVFQPVPVHNNHTQHHHQHHGHQDHQKAGHLEGHSILQSASLTRENYTAESNKTAKGTVSAPASPSNTTSSNSSNSSSSSSTSINSSSSSSSGSNSGSVGGIVTLHESAVTLAVMEDTNATRNSDNDTDDEQDADHSHAQSTEKVEDEEEEKKDVEDTATTEVPGTSEDPASAAQVAAVTVVDNPSTPAVVAADNNTVIDTTTSAPRKASNLTSAAPASSSAPPAPAAAVAAAAVAAAAPAPVTSTTHAPVHTTGKVPSTKQVKVPSVASTAKVTNTTTSPTTSTSTSSRPPLPHKLVYVATTASGNHIGGFCVWKTDRNITRWSYFYENIPIEYQSQQDSPDHEMRGMLAAVRTWAPLWHDHHVVLRSHHQTIKGSDHPTRQALTRELEKLSKGHFTYELEWRLKKTDRVVDISYCLSRLHRDFAHWFRVFEGRVDELLGQQNWSVAREKNKVEISKDAFFTDYPNDLDDITRKK